MRLEVSINNLYIILRHTNVCTITIAPDLRDPVMNEWVDEREVT